MIQRIGLEEGYYWVCLSGNAWRIGFYDPEMSAFPWTLIGTDNIFGWDELYDLGPMVPDYEPENGDQQNGSRTAL